MIALSLVQHGTIGFHVDLPHQTELWESRDRLTRPQGPAQGQCRVASWLILEEGPLGLCQEQLDPCSLEVLSEPHGIHWGVESHKPPAS